MKYTQDIGSGQKLAAVPGALSVDRAFPAHYQASPAAAGAHAILNATALLATCPQLFTVNGVKQPEVPSVLSIKGSAAGITGNVVIVGTDVSDSSITDTIALSGANMVVGSSAKVFKTIVSITLPARNAANNTVSVGTDQVIGACLAATTLPTSGTYKIVVSALSQPDVTRNLVVTGKASGMTGNVVITGKNVAGQAISSTFALNGTNAQTGVLAFKTIESILIPAMATAGDTVDVGTGSKLGLSHCRTINTTLMTLLNGVAEGTAPTVVVDSDEVEKNVITLNSALAGTQVDYFYLI